MTNDEMDRLLMIVISVVRFLDSSGPTHWERQSQLDLIKDNMEALCSDYRQRMALYRSHQPDEVSDSYETH